MLSARKFVWNGHSCPLPLTLMLIFDLSRSTAPCIDPDREGQDVHRVPQGRTEF